MGYRIFITELSEEVRSLMLALLHIKEEDGSLSPGEGELLARLKQGQTPPEVQRKARVRAGSSRASQSQQ